MIKLDFKRLLDHYGIETKGEHGGQAMIVCPFHDDHGPSCSVNMEEGVFYCFSCGAKGNVVSFVMKREKISYRDALDWVNRFYGSSLEYVGPASISDEVRREAAKKWSILKRLSKLPNEECGWVWVAIITCATSQKDIEWALMREDERSKKSDNSLDWVAHGLVIDASAQLLELWVASSGRNDNETVDVDLFLGEVLAPAHNFEYEYALQCEACRLTAIFGDRFRDIAKGMNAVKFDRYRRFFMEWIVMLKSATSAGSLIPFDSYIMRQAINNE